MSRSYKILGAINPLAATETEFVVVPSNHEHLGTVRVCNIDSVSVTYRLAHTSVSGAAVAKDWDIFDTELEPGETDDITMEMGPGETLRAYASTANVAFKFSGMDIDNA